MIKRLIRFALVGGLNTGVDIGIITLLAFLLPAKNLVQLIGYNTIAYSIGACNSFFLNKFWTFNERTPVTMQQVGKFVLVTIGGIILNNVVLSMFSLLWPALAYGSAWDTLTLKVGVAATCMLLSFVALNLLVFAVGKEPSVKIPTGKFTGKFGTSISIILPAYNEQDIISETVRHVYTEMTRLVSDFEIIVVNDGSKDHTRRVVEELTRYCPCLRLINHDVNKGYGAALVTGFTNTSKELAFFMDSDGQFDIADIAYLLPLIGQYDAVLGYRINRRDALMRKLNAWGWKQIARFLFGVKVKDVDCAFKLYPARFFREMNYETGGAMINVEMLYKFTRAGYSYAQVGVRHLPRKTGKATGAKLAVIARALRDAFACAEKWSQA
jgi:putative flippase GtrA